MGKLRPFVRKDSYMPNKKWIPFVIGNGYTTTDGASGPAPEWETVTGNPVSFNAITPFPLKQLSVAFSPVQDLHGYDSPWPAGGHYNQWDEEWEVGGLNDTTGGNWNTDTRIRSKNYIPILPSTAYYNCMPTAGVALTVCYYDATKTFISSTTPAAQITFTTPQNAEFMRFATYAQYGTTYNHDIAINYPATVTTYSPYSNICPISGWSSLTVEQAGKNLLDMSAWLDSIGVQYTIDSDGWYIISGTTGTKGNLYSNVYTFPLIHGSVYMELDQSRTTVTNLRPSVLRNGNPIAEGPNGNPSVTKLENRWVNQFRFNFSSGGTLCVKVSIVNATTVSSYQPYNPSSRSISISLGETVYSGYVDVVTGVGEVTMAAVDMGSISWTYASAFDCFTALVGRGDYRAKEAFSAKCSSYPFVGAYSKLTDKSCAYIYNINVAVKDTAYGTDANAFGTAMSGVQLVYELATPIPIQLTPQEVESLLGVNNMWSNANQPITVTYRSN